MVSAGTELSCMYKRVLPSGELTIIDIASADPFPTTAMYGVIDADEHTSAAVRAATQSLYCIVDPES